MRISRWRGRWRATREAIARWEGWRWAGWRWIGWIFRLGLAVLGAWALFELPLEPGGIPRPRTAYGISLDAVVIVGCVIAARLLPPRFHLELPRLRWLGSGWALLGGAVWALLTSFEIGRASTLYATNNDLPLYDSVMLAHHLYRLGQDLYGGWAHAALAALLLSPLFLWALGTVALGRVEAAAARMGRRWLLLMCAVVAFVGAISDREAYSTRFITPIALDNAQRSLGLWREFQEEVERGPMATLAGAELTVQPDVVFYVVESYGQVVQSNPEMQALWEPVALSLQDRIQGTGFHVVSGLSDAPVHGGRSWIADASVLFGLHVAHEATYEHLLTLADSLPHMASFFARRGYTTLLVKPKDRARPGLALTNPFGFHKTVFALDLDYRGPFYGWGEIPDQFTIDRVEEEVMGPIESPIFAFFHLVTSHMPWREVPPLQNHWSDWQGQLGPRNPVFVERDFANQLRMQLSHWKRVLRNDRPQKEATSEQPRLYTENVIYDLESTVALLERGIERPRLMIVMGDHQPPLVAPGTGPEVIVHVMATDERWLEPFLARGFVPGMVPPTPPAKMKHRDLFPAIVEALSARP